MPGRIERFTNDGLELGVIDRGPIDGRPIVLLHGFPQRASCWDNVTPILNDAGYRTFAVDQRGYTPNARPKGIKAYKVENLARDAIALVDTLGVDKVDLVGHDWGSFVGYTVAGLYPNRVRTYTSVSLPHPKAFAKSFTSSPQALHSWYMFFFQLPVLPETMLINLKGIRKAQLRGSGMDERMLARYEQEMVKDGALPGGINWYRAFRYFADVHNITVPTTHIWGRHDNSLEERRAQLNAQFIDAPYEFKIIEDGNHWLPDQNASEVAENILARVRSVA